LYVFLQQTTMKGILFMLSKSLVCIQARQKYKFEATQRIHKPNFSI